MVVVVTPSMVMETSLTMVLAEPPPPDPELPPADCEDDSDEVDEAAPVDEAADVEDAADDDAVAAGTDVVTAAVVDAIALIDMETSLEGDIGQSADYAPPILPSTHTARKAGAALRKIRPGRPFILGARPEQPNAASCVAGFSHRSRGVRECQRSARARHGRTVVSSHVRVSRSAAGEFLRASRDQ